MVAIGAITQGAVVAIAIVGLAVVYFDKLSTISGNLTRIADSMEDIDDTNFDQITNSVEQIDRKVTSVDLKEIERTTNRMKFFIDNQQNGSRTNANNSVRYEFEDIDNIVSISFGEYAVRDSWQESAEISSKHGDLIEYDEPIEYTSIEFEFFEEIDTLLVSEELTLDKDMYELESELFTQQVIINAHSPYEIEFDVPTRDLDAITEWIPTILEKIEKFQGDRNSDRQEFDDILEKKLH